MDVDVAMCHTCRMELPLHESYFYKSKGKWWVYRCIECSTERNKKYYKENVKPNNPRGRPSNRRPKMAKDFRLDTIPQEDVCNARRNK